MANFTENAIKESFLKLLAKHPLNEITVKSITDECGINRNSFYYHYKGIPELIEEIIIEHFDYLISKYPSITSLNDGIKAALNYALKNKVILMHIYNSVNRALFEQHLMKYFEHLVTLYIKTAFKGVTIRESDKRLIIRLAKCELFGGYIDWMNSGMPESIIDESERLFEICEDFSLEVIKRCQV